MPTRTRSTRALLAAFAALGGFLSYAQSQSVATTPVGAVTLAAQANSETFFSVPLSRPIAYSGVLASVSGSVLQLSGSPGWSSDQFVKAVPAQPNTFYVRLRSGAHAGQYFTVTANTSDSLTVDSNGLDLSLLIAGDKVEVTPYWTLGALFPASAAGVSFIASASAFNRQTEIYFPNFNYSGINVPTADTFFFTNNAWRKVGASASLSFDDQVLPPDVFVKVRNRAAPSTLTVVGQVESGAIGTIINNGTVKTDNIVSISFPADVTLGDSGLISSGAFSSSPNAFSRTDELLVYSDVSAGLNRPATATYYYASNAWRKVGAAATADFSSDAVFKTAKGVVIRKAASPTPSSVKWTYAAVVN